MKFDLHSRVFLELKLKHFEYYHDLRQKKFDKISLREPRGSLNIVEAFGR